MVTVTGRWSPRHVSQVTGSPSEYSLDANDRCYLARIQIHSPVLTPQRDPTAIKLTTRLAVVNSKILVLEAQRASHGSVNGGATEDWSGQRLLAKLSAERQALEKEIAKQG